MSQFKVVLLKHGYAKIEHERRIITEAGGEFIDADTCGEAEAWRECEQADGILVRWVKITPERIRQFRRCKIIVRYGVGYDNVDVNAATAAGMMVGHIPTYCLDEVSTHAIALLLGCVRNVVGKHQKMERGSWDFNPVEKLWRMAGRSLGLIGLGNIGRGVARKMKGWGLRLLAADPYVDPSHAEALGVRMADLETVCREADYLSLHVPLLPETRHLISRRELALMKPSAILINTARGPVLDNKALLEALNEGRLAQAGLDVFEEEPVPVDSPLRRHPRVLLSDHIAYYSEESQVELQITAAEEVVRVCTGGLPRSLANPEVLRCLGRWEEWTPNETVKWQMKRLEKLKALA